MLTFAWMNALKITKAVSSHPTGTHLPLSPPEDVIDMKEQMLDFINSAFSSGEVNHLGKNT